ncbi:ABC transporter ATP-binding protein [Evansella cellulosilytica]|uniref:ABC transporter related protein n=1 Tax=Evansella cellulosilytica (strain ATCC 21833 / DSM 2522 / FERM P-1141 / JCM 9156 / N-4) TaxID=649639 RepID=E6TVJ8_EVAC2|nr:ABC transporter ATP-binding protein [Evansella cellulosilytica]ADU31015.1 ABC transporter related protein [Evansella cellulosilytica DSM 2522]
MGDTTLSGKSNSRLVFQYILKMIPILMKISPSLLLLTICLRVLQIGVPLIQVYLTTILVEQVTLVTQFGVGEMRRAIIILLIQFLFLFISTLLKSFNRYLMSKLNYKTKYYFDRLVAEKASRLPLVLYENADYYNQLERASGQSERAMSFVDNCFSIIQNAVTITGFLVILFSFHWGLALSLITIIFPSLIVNIKTGKWRFQQMLQQTPAERKSMYLLDLLSTRQAAKEIRIFGLKDFLTTRWSYIYWKNAREKLSLDKKTEIYISFVDLSGIVVNTLAAAFLIWLGALGRVTIGHYVALTQALIQVHTMLDEIAHKVANVYEDALYTSTLFSFLSLPTENSEEKNSLPFPNIINAISVNGVSFSYPSHEKNVLDNVSFSINPGEKIAIVGENGSGKTTLAKCLLGLYKPLRGEILINELDLADINKEELRKYMTAVFQDFVQYQFTAKDNIAVGKPELVNNVERIKSAAQISGAHKFITQLDKGYDTELGPYFFGGQEISLGQWQKVAISRAFLRNAEIIVLDEPTASLDPISEAEIFNDFMRLSQGKTAIFITHRLGSCKLADRILVLKEGRLIEEGKHEELIAVNGEYHKMF